LCICEVKNFVLQSKKNIALSSLNIFDWRPVFVRLVHSNKGAVMDARIFKPSKTAMQSGHGNTDEWVLEYEPKSNRKPEPLMGWTSSTDTLNQVRLHFKTLDEAKDYAARKGLTASVLPDRPRKLKPRNYADNFRYRPEDEA
jgi:hypothetical protein